MKIYLASSWRNADQPRVLALLRAAGHKVYDFRNPVPGNEGFQWKAVDPEGPPDTVLRLRKALVHPVAQQGFMFDLRALVEAEATVLLLPLRTLCSPRGGMGLWRRTARHRLHARRGTARAHVQARLRHCRQRRRAARCAAVTT